MDHPLSNSHETLFGQVEDGTLGHEQGADLPAIAWADAPIIGIPIPVQQGSQGPYLATDAVGIWAVERLHGRVFLLPLWPFPPHGRRYHALWPLLPLMDGLLLPARLVPSFDEEHASHRDDQPDVQRWSTAWEMALAQLATVMGMPILAIGDGAYRWHLALSGALQQDEPPASRPSSPASCERRPLHVRAQVRWPIGLSRHTRQRSQVSPRGPYRSRHGQPSSSSLQACVPARTPTTGG